MRLNGKWATRWVRRSHVTTALALHVGSVKVAEVQHTQYPPGSHFHGVNAYYAVINTKDANCHTGYGTARDAKAAILAKLR